MTRFPLRLLSLLLLAASIVTGSVASAVESFTKQFNSAVTTSPFASKSKLAKQRDLTGGLTESLSKSPSLPASPKVASDELYHKILKGTGWVVVPTDEGTSYTGTCVVIDKQKRLAITNHHVVRQLKKGVVLFPEYEDGELKIKAAEYAKSGHAIGFKVLAVDSRRDLALLELDVLPRGIEALPFAKSRPEVGDELHSVGNSEHGYNFEGRLWTHRTEKVTATLFAVLQEAEVQKGGPTEARMMITTPAFAHGDSGGPIVNQRGELVGVVAAINAAGGWSIDLVEVRHFLADPELKSLKAGEQGKLVGEWKANFEINSAPGVMVASFGKDGTIEFYGAKTLTGDYELAGDEIKWTLQDSSIREQGSITWVDDNHFVVTVGQMEYRFERR